MEYSSSSHENSSPWLSVSLFEAFSSSNNALTIDSTRITTTTTGFQQEHHVPIFTGEPKLENFLGGSQFSAINNNTISCTNPNSNSNAAAKKSVDNFGQRTSIYRGVTRHRWTGRYEAHLWDNSCRREGQSRKGRQVYLGGYDKEDKAARAYDLAALKYWGLKTLTNLPVSNYEKELEAMKNMTRQEFVASLRRKSSGFSRGASIYRGVTRHHQHGRWQARIGRVAGNKDLYLGTFSTQEEAAEAYDIAAIKFRGLNAVTNFDMSRYDIKSIATNNLPIGGISNPKPISQFESESVYHNLDAESSVSMLSFSIPIPIPIIKQNPNNNNNSSDCWSDIFGVQNPNVVITKSNTVPAMKSRLTVSNDHDPLLENSGYDQSSSNTSSRYNGNGLEQNNNINSVGPSLQSFHDHRRHSQVKPVADFQTPIMGE